MIFRPGMQAVGPVGAMGVVRDGATVPETVTGLGNDDLYRRRKRILNETCRFAFHHNGKGYFFHTFARKDIIFHALEVSVFSSPNFNFSRQFCTA